MAKVTEMAAQLAQPFITEAAGCSLWDVEYVKEAGSGISASILMGRGRVHPSDCEAVSAPVRCSGRGRPH